MGAVILGRHLPIDGAGTPFGIIWRQWPWPEIPILNMPRHHKLKSSHSIRRGHATKLSSPSTPSTPSPSTPPQLSSPSTGPNGLQNWKQTEWSGEKSYKIAHGSSIHLATFLGGGGGIWEESGHGGIWASKMREKKAWQL